MSQTPPIHDPVQGLPPLKKRRLWLRVVLLLVALLASGALYIGLDAYRFLTSPASLTPQEVIISIDEGATFDRVAWDLKKAGAITDVPRFRLLAQYKKSLSKIQAGEFSVSTGWTPEQVLTQITLGKPLLYKLRLREGLTLWETANAVEEQGFAKAEHFKEVLSDPEFLRQHHIPFASAEGFLWPETYLLRKPKKMDKAQARAVASLLVNTFWAKTKPLWTQLPAREPSEVPGQPKSPVHKAVTAVANATVGVVADAMQGAINESAYNATQQATQDVTQNAAQDALPQGSLQATAAGATQVGAANGTAPAATEPAGAFGASTDKDAEDAAAQAQTTPQQVHGVTPEKALAEADSKEQRKAAARPMAPQKPVHPSQIDKKALHNLLILASLVEKETAIPAERAVVAGVYANRLRIGMLLQCDPTIPYGIGEEFRGPIRRSQLQDKNNPYNTYQHPGLPPGPICSSGLAALQAALTPGDHKYLYFVATGTDGGHVFSRNLAEHSQAVQAYRKTQGR